MGYLICEFLLHQLHGSFRVIKRKREKSIQLPMACQLAVLNWKSMNEAVITVRAMMPTVRLRWRDREIERMMLRKSPLLSSSRVGSGAASIPAGLRPQTIRLMNPTTDVLARYLAAMARMLDFRVTICDPREELADPFPLSDVSYIRQMPDEAVRALTRQPRTAVVTLAHDPKQDDLALTAALESDAFYIGALGSVRSAAARRERLLGLGFTAGQIARICGPAGLPIGSKRPSEIALSILAEITATRNGMVEATPAGNPKRT